MQLYVIEANKPWFFEREQYENQESDYSASKHNFKAIPGVGTGPLWGLTPDDVRARPDYRIAKQAMDKAFAALRAFNAVYVKRYKNELAAERKLKREGKKHDTR